jgi:Co/Zn/Cd efflux system component
MHRIYIYVQHVCADTMRSITVLIAAAIAMCFTHFREVEPTPQQQQYYAVMADSIGALVVSILILLSIVPLLHGLYRTGQQILQLHRQSYNDDYPRVCTSSTAASTTTTTFCQYSKLQYETMMV